MNCNGKQFGFFALAMVLVFSSLAEAKTKNGCAEKKREAQYSSDWTGLKTTKDLHMIEGTYKGTGSTTKHRYYMHLMQYLDQENAFIALMEDDTKKVARLGYLMERSKGVYDWYGFKMDREGAFDLIYPPIEEGPLFSFSFKLDGDGDVKTIKATNLNAQYQLESIEFGEARKSLLRESLHKGSWNNRWMKKKDSAEFIPDDDQTDAGCANGASKYTIQLNQTNSEKGGETQSTYSARRDLPGVYTLHVQKMDGYVADVSAETQYVAIAINGFNDRAWSNVWQAQKRSARTFLFRVDGDFLSGDPLVLVNK